MSQLDDCGKDGCYRDDGDSGKYCPCGQFWCSYHLCYIIGSKCVKCNSQKDDEDTLFEACFREVCPYGKDCPGECDRSHPEHDDTGLSDDTLGKALGKCLSQYGIECLADHTHDLMFPFAFSLPSMASWISARNAIDSLSKY